MMSIAEGDLRFEFAPPFVVARFDDWGHERQSWKKVDFIVRGNGETWLIEVKDPQNRFIPDKERANALTDFRRKLDSGELFHAELAPKGRDSLLYLWLKAETSIEVKYHVLLGADWLDGAALSILQDRLDRECWEPTFVPIVLNIESWNRRMPEHPVKRPD
ncbi:MAG: hypothetical protein ACOYON_01845 [Fimbriimonas sp.]